LYLAEPAIYQFIPIGDHPAMNTAQHFAEFRKRLKRLLGKRSA
jgi:hypothetical protein